jgi:2-methylisocitrate lyase-like PEP mutase family enzyme
MSQADILRTLIQAPALLVMPGIFDGFSARLVEQAGFPAGFISGGGLSETLLGYSDVGLMGFELNLAAITRLAACCTIPLLADADTGYGNAVNVYHTTRAFEQASADLLFADALVSEADIATVARHVPKPLCVNMGFGIRSRATTPLIAPEQLQALGVAVVIYPRLLTACAIQGMKHGIAALRDAMQSPTVLARPELAVSFEELNALVGFAELQARERRYATEPTPKP